MRKTRYQIRTPEEALAFLTDGLATLKASGLNHKGGEEVKFRYYIVSGFDGNIRGTNDEKVAKNFSGSSDDFVIDTQNNLWLQDEEVGVEIPEYAPKKKSKK